MSNLKKNKTVKKFKDLNVWKKAIDLVKAVYSATNDFPEEEKFGLTSQIRRSAVSIPSNIAEGSGRDSDKEFNHFLNIARGSTFELETQLIISGEIGILNSDELNQLSEKIDEIQRMITNLQKKL